MLLSHDNWRCTDRVIAAAEHAGLPAPCQPLVKGKVIGPLTIDLTKVTSSRLGELLAEYTAQTGCASYAATIADLEANADEQALESVTARVRLLKTGTVQERSDKATNDPQVKAATKKALESRSLAALVQTVYRNYERDLNAISREITRRGQERIP